MTFTELTTLILKVCPEAVFDEDLEGQIIIYTNLQLPAADGPLEQFNVPEVSK